LNTYSIYDMSSTAKDKIVAEFEKKFFDSALGKVTWTPSSPYHGRIDIRNHFFGKFKDEI